MTIGLHMLVIMTTGLQKVIPLERPAPRLERPVLRDTRLRGWLHGFAARLRLLPREIAAARAPSARDVHDAAVMRGVFPPRI
jgi:hypothetical protein